MKHRTHDPLIAGTPDFEGRTMNRLKTSSYLRTGATVSLSASLCIALAACGAVKPKPLTQDEITQRVTKDKAVMYADQEPLAGPLTLSDAMARALKYNLDYRLKLMETALNKGMLDVASLDMLPKLMTDAGYRWRSNDSGGTSIGIQDRVISLRPSTSEERVHFLADATLSWDALDFGLSYYRAKQQADEVNISEERRRQVLQSIVQDVRDAYWRALGAQRMLAEADTLSTNIATALEQSRQAERAGVLPPAEGLEYQRALLDAMSLVNQKRQEMEFARAELAALMNVRPGTAFTLADAPEATLAQVPVDVDKLETMALTQRPELRQEDYKTRIDAIETKKQIASLFPNLNFFGGKGYDNNQYLYNSAWSQGGVSVSMNLMRLAGIPAIRRTNDARMKVDDTRRMALSMAVLTQVRISVERYKLAVYDHQIAEDSSRVDQRLASISRAGSDNQLTSNLESLRTQARSIVSRFQEASAYAAAQSAYGRVLNSVGIDLMPAQIRSTDVAAISASIKASLAQGEGEVFPGVTSAVAVDRPVSVAIDGLPPRVDAEVIRGAVEKVMVANRIAVDRSTGGLAYRMHFSVSPSRAAQRAEWTLTVVDANGKSVLTQTYRSYLPDQASTPAVSALAEAATLSVIGELHAASAAPATAAADEGR
jgi:outer membrane protein TolC